MGLLQAEPEEGAFGGGVEEGDDFLIAEGDAACGVGGADAVFVVGAVDVDEAVEGVADWA